MGEPRTQLNIGAANISLPLPNNLNYSSQFKWENKEFGTTGVLFEQFLEGEGVLGGLTNVAKNTGSTFKRGAAQGLDAFQKTAQLSQLAPNPKEAIMFRGVTFRTYSLEFTLTGESGAEVKEKAHAVNELHRVVAPELIDQKTFWKYPPGGTLIIYGAGGILLPKRGIYVTEISVNFNPGSQFYPTFADGTPVQLDLTIGIIERNLPSKENDKDLLKL